VDKLLAVDWHALFVPSASIAEIVIRGIITYFVLFGVLRVMRRETGAIGISDLLVVVLIADAIQNGMAGSYTSITEGVVLVVTIALCDYLLDWVGYRFPSFQRILRPAPLLLIDNGTVNRRNLRQEMITMEELMSLLREQGVDDVAEVKRCFLEGDGKISVVQKEPGRNQPSDRDDARMQ
jgi:uncharacterized membrane protein YcaP (DUF421 family)